MRANKAEEQENILTLLRELTEEPELSFFYTQLLADHLVQQVANIPTKEQVKKYFHIFRKGVEYALNTYGIGVLPSGNIQFFQSLTEMETNEILTKLLCYAPLTDAIYITSSYIAEQCRHYKDGEPDVVCSRNRLPSGRGVRMEDYTLLQAIEECYHRYQRHVKQYPIVNTRIYRGHYIEKEIESVWGRAISDLNIKLYFVYEDIEDI